MNVPDIASAIEAAAGRGERMALATLVEVEGSAYLRPGARLVVPEHGDPTGQVSPGCLEAELVDVGRAVIAAGRPRIHRFDLTAEDEAELGWGLGCRGILDVFVEPGSTAIPLAAELRTVREERRPRAIVTLLEGDAAGARLSLDETGVPDRSLGSASLDLRATELARQAMIDERSAMVKLDAGLRAFVELVRPPIRLILCGDRADAGPLADAAAAIGWEVDRAGRRDDPGEDLVDGRTFAVVMNHHYVTDRQHVRALLASPVPYIGVLGPRARTERLLADLDVEREDLPRLYAPAGLDLGAEGPHEVAHAIVAEIIAVDRGRSGGPLRDRQASIHAVEPLGARE